MYRILSILNKKNPESSTRKDSGLLDYFRLAMEWNQYWSQWLSADFDA